MKWVYNSVLACLITMPVWAADTLYLEGVSILGSKKNAYISFNGGQVTVNEGDSVGTWTVVKIDSRLVTLAAGNGEVKELPLHAQISVDTPPAAEQKPANTNVNVPFIPDDKVPAGHRKIRTPFGDVLVKDDNNTGTYIPSKALDGASPPENTIPAVPNATNNGNTTASPAVEGQRSITTPFGQLIVKDQNPEKAGQ
ncbi:hypothetical protein BegalDRAFT_2042 [Beggiatoa alba B18LD]|uniref:Uncharacterized protein n=1 Tax=Beggiatoa alba B18LD TaxID=395493 RepID=I3CH15_9GAMM|nr:hypothetical protein [Beggiatoa alba]EIJ42908.1 hypothetical protein BegalDRAFT_2042 [Beggiatoa alba B18LD]